MAKPKSKPKSKLKSKLKSKHVAATLPPGAPRPGRLREIYDELQRLPNVTGCFVGWKRSGGRLTRQLCIVACVEEKLGTKAIAASSRVPKTVRWKISSRRTGSLPTDVQEIGPGEFHRRPVVGAGDGIAGFSLPGSGPIATRGTLGVAMRHPTFGPVVTTAAHVVGVRAFGATTFPPGHEPRVALQNGGRGTPLTGIVRRVVMGPSTDYALVVGPPGVPVENLYVDSEPLGALYAPDRRDIGTVVYVLTSRGPLRTRLRGLHADVVIEGLPFRDLILTDFATVGGDSGACLVDADSRVIGMVEGALPVDGRMCSAFTPASLPFVIEGGEYF